MSTVFVALSQLMKKVQDGKGDIATEEFLTVCRHIIPVVGVRAASFGIALSMLYPAKGRSRISCTEIPLPDVEFYTAEKFGASFALVRSDLGGNIDRLETARRKNISKYASLYPIILDEINRKEQGEKYSDSKALLWLKRALDFIKTLLQLLYKDRLITMSSAASQAYTDTLYQFHTWYTSAAFQLALKLVPSRETFFEKLEVRSEADMQEMETFLQSFAALLQDIQHFLKLHNLDDPTPV